MRAGLASVSAGLIASVLAHLMLIVAVAVPHQRQTAHGESVTVELVPSDEAPAFNDPDPSDQAPKAEAARKPEAQPDWSQLQNKPPAPESDVQSQTSPPTAPSRQRAANQQASQRPQPQQQQQDQQQQKNQQQQPPSAQQQQQPPQSPQQSAAAQPQSAAQPQPESPEQPQVETTPENPAEQGARLAALLGLPSPGGASDLRASDVNADIKSDEMAAFKAHLKKCWKSPPGYSESQKIKVVVRVMLRKDGKLAKDPEGVEITPASLAFPSYTSAITALKQCQPYTMLPAEKYNEWRVLDVNMSPDQMAGG